jgi:hypothetical protein
MAMWKGDSMLLVLQIQSPVGVVVCVLRVIASEVWLRPKTMVVLGLG